MMFKLLKESVNYLAEKRPQKEEKYLIAAL